MNWSTESAGVVGMEIWGLEKFSKSDTLIAKALCKLKLTFLTVILKLKIDKNECTSLLE